MRWNFAFDNDNVLNPPFCIPSLHAGPPPGYQLFYSFITVSSSPSLDQCGRTSCDIVDRKWRTKMCLPFAFLSKILPVVMHRSPTNLSDQPFAMMWDMEKSLVDCHWPAQSMALCYVCIPVSVFVSLLFFRVDIIYNLFNRLWIDRTIFYLKFFYLIFTEELIFSIQKENRNFSMYSITLSMIT